MYKMSKKSIFILRKISGRTIHGLSKTDLVSMAKSGMIAPEDEIRKEGQKTWHPASAIRGLPAQQKVSNKSQSPAPKTESRLGKKAIIFTSSFLIIALTVFGGVFGIWFIVRDYGLIKNTSNNESIVTETVSPTTNNESNQRSSIASTSSTAPPVEPLDKSPIALKPTAPQPNIEVPPDTIEDIRSSGNTEDWQDFTRDLSDDQYTLLPTGAEVPQMLTIGGITVPKTGPIWVQEKLQMPVIGSFILRHKAYGWLTMWSHTRRTLHPTPLVIEHINTKFPAHLPHMYYYPCEYFGETILAELGNSNYPPYPKPINNVVSALGSLGFGQAVYSLRADDYKYNWINILTLSTLDYFQSGHKYKSKTGSNGNIERITIIPSSSFYGSERNFMFSRDIAGRVISIDEFDSNGTSSGISYEFEYDGKGRLAKFNRIVEGDSHGPRPTLNPTTDNISFVYESNLLRSLIMKTNNNQKEISRFNYSYDDLQRVSDIYFRLERPNYSKCKSISCNIKLDYNNSDLYWNYGIIKYTVDGETGWFVASRDVSLDYGLILKSLNLGEAQKEKQKEEDENDLSKPATLLSAKELMKFCNSMYEGVRNLEAAIQSADAHSFISAAEKINKLDYGNPDAEIFPRIQAFLKKLANTPESEIDPELVASLNKMSQANKKMRDIKSIKNSSFEARQLRKIFDEIMIDSDLLVRYRKIDLRKNWFGRD